jgi:hypothetical protein
MPSPSSRVRRLAAGLVVASLATLLLVSPAAAHDPIFLTEDQDTPATGPYLPDGTISFALYGSLYEPGETRGFEFDLRDGDDLYLSLLIPDLEPEVSLADGDLPWLVLLDPEGNDRPFRATIREPFADPFSGTDYVTLFETQEPAAGGRYQVVVTGEAPTRFVVAVGTSEEFFTPTERAVDRPTSFPGIAEPLDEWYTTPADGSEPVNASPVAGEGVEVDEELIEQELAKLDEEAATEAEAEADDTAETVSTEPEEEAAPETDSESGSSLTWLAPLAIVVAAGAGGALAFRRRRGTA